MQTPVGAGPDFDRERLSGDRPREGVLPPVFVSVSPAVAGAADCWWGNMQFYPWRHPAAVL